MPGIPSYSYYSRAYHPMAVVAPRTGAYPLPPPPPLPTFPGGSYAFPPPPPLPILPPPNNQYLSQFQNLLGQFSGYNALPTLPPDVAALINQQMEAIAQRRFDTQRAQLFGSGVERSSIADQQVADLSSILAGEQAQQELGAREFLGQQGLAALTGQAGALGTAAGLEGNQYAQLIQGLLGVGGLAQQQYATQGQELLGAGGLAQQQYATQSQAALQQQQMMMDWINRILSGGAGAFGAGIPGATAGGAPGGGIGGGVQPPGMGGTGAGAISPQMLEQAFYRYIMNLLGGGGIPTAPNPLGGIG